MLRTCAAAIDWIDVVNKHDLVYERTILINFAIINEVTIRKAGMMAREFGRQIGGDFSNGFILNDIHDRMNG